MNETWQPNFDFYETHKGQDRAVVTLDLGAAAHAPLATHPVRLQFRVKMRGAQENGLRSAEEAPALFALEDQLVEAACSKLQAIYTGRVVSQGFTEFSFYVPAAQREQLETAGAEVGPTAPYELEWLVEDDPDWSVYEELYPNRCDGRTPITSCSPCSI